MQEAQRRRTVSVEATPAAGNAAVSRRAALRRLGITILVILAGLALSLTSFLVVLHGRQITRRSELTRIGGNIAAALQTTFQVDLVALEGVASYLNTAGDVSREQFKRFVYPALERHPGLLAMEWAPRVRQDERDRFEAQVRAEGFVRFRLTERGPGGQRVEMGRREEYFPILYVEPFAGNVAAFGYADMGESRSQVIAAARDSGRPAASARLELIQEQSKHFGLLVFVPLYVGGSTPATLEERQRLLRGFVEGVFRIDALFRSELDHLNQRGTRFALFDDADSTDVRPLYLSNEPPEQPAPWLMTQAEGAALRAQLEQGLHVHDVVELAGRPFDLVTFATADFTSALPGLEPLLILVGGMLLTLLMASYLSLHMSRTARVEELVLARTAELHASEAQLRQAQRLESVGRLAGGIAHDFNNLLTAIIGGVQLASLDAPSGSAMAQELQNIRQAADRAATLVRQLLAFSRRQVLHPEPIDLNAVIMDMRGMLQRLIGEGLELSVQLQEDLGHSHADRGQMEQVILNLVLNARDAMPDGGQVTLSTADEEVEQDGELRRLVRFSVSDTGAGMSELVRSRIFEPFFSTKEVGKGTGLGLSTVYGIVTQSGGTIDVASEPGKGTRFDIRLPRHQIADEKTAAAAGMTPAVPPVPAQRSRAAAGTHRAQAQQDGCLLVVEDDDDVRAAVTKVLAGAGYTVLEAADGVAALRIQAEQPGDLKLVLTDLVMPGLDGGRLAWELTARDPAIHVLLMTGYADERAAAAAAGLANCGVLQKPFAREELLAAVRAALANA
jgi:signal transduction histidine kinase/CheY-like chemotaxis protein/sensor domain CHASE-containing protein